MPKMGAVITNAKRTQVTLTPKCRLMPLQTPTSQRPRLGRNNGSLVGSSGSGGRMALVIFTIVPDSGSEIGALSVQSGNNQGVP